MKVIRPRTSVEEKRWIKQRIGKTGRKNIIVP